MTTQYMGSQGFNGEGTIKMWYGNYPGNHFYRNLSGWAILINSEYHEQVSSLYVYYPWHYYYMLIGNANMLLEHIDGAEGSQDDRNFIKAQGLTFRAYSYMMLAQLYCYRWVDSNNGATDGLPLRIDTSQGDLELSTLKETYQLIYDDLDEAIRLFSSSSSTRSSFYEPDLNVAYATYARAALNKQDYEKAADCAAKARQGYPLMSVDQYKAGFCEANSEWIWGSVGLSDESLYYYSFAAYIAYNSTASVVRSYPACMDKQLYDQIPETDIRRDLFLDPQGYPYSLSNGVAGDDLWDLAFELYPDLQSSAFIYAHMQFKMKTVDQPGVADLNHFRSSEMYLIEAEANYFLNQEQAARDLLVELTKNSGRDPDYACNKTGSDLFEEIKKYRAIELWGEGFDWFDYKRWNENIERKTGAEGGSFLASLAVTITPEEKNRWTWKIPLRETDYNTLID